MPLSPSIALAVRSSESTNAASLASDEGAAVAASARSERSMAVFSELVPDDGSFAEVEPTCADPSPSERPRASRSPLTSGAERGGADEQRRDVSGAWLPTALVAALLLASPCAA